MLKNVESTCIRCGGKGHITKKYQAEYNKDVIQEEKIYYCPFR